MCLNGFGDSAFRFCFRSALLTLTHTPSFLLVAFSCSLHLPLDCLCCNLCQSFIMRKEFPWQQVAPRYDWSSRVCRHQRHSVYLRSPSLKTSPVGGIYRVPLTNRCVTNLLTRQQKSQQISGRMTNKRYKANTSSVHLSADIHFAVVSFSKTLNAWIPAHTPNLPDRKWIEETMPGE